MSFLRGVGKTDGKTVRRESRLLVISEVYTLFIGAPHILRSPTFVSFLSKT